uniref:Uncharacterized protein n=1 Tax=Ahnfeltia plicata TaxID=28023 RepID=A0A1C9CB47_9FLOR|nr:hypothetical protein Ahnf_126 [Ahnfeltia plicata]AOM65611.1 hypothetical protein Ahnf_126 [Ahnfeltia plicata]UAT97386.1 hypothetical protein Ahn.pli.Chile.pt_070 [Ahnfeltia plicata]
MDITNLTRNNLLIDQKSYLAISFVLKLRQQGDIWLFNCSEGCQHILTRKQIKISQISKIIITELHISNITGLLGLLSSLSLSSRIKTLHIYGPPGLEKYVEFGRKYSQTNFRYKLHIHKLSTGLIVNHPVYQIYSFANYLSHSQLEFLIISKEKIGKFNLDKAEYFNIIPGPLYGKLKIGNDFLLPDGSIISGGNFTGEYDLGYKISFILKLYYKRKSIEIGWKSQVLIC